ncbi:MAG: hypothetical protein A2W91_14185 [Bacteroidetes bacterium GWF2_38_335]|nr:MAG: hypothetical protein A2W91_14185 [Bacteroidetes bacterium GWF2_38_335]OFY79388.1 MAG: hypothetical protein A2281_16970 [Bacteroidetes bacterium RIFOXYA12_FULL_38_20]HBS85652.1 coproporphyrinogen III oxidase [Bacteroidales bacterium]
MAGIYIHIPFCKQRCHYCDFHSSDSMAEKTRLIECISLELKNRNKYLGNEPVETIYFGGGTPSVLNKEELSMILEAVRSNYNVIQNPEITIELNPDDLSVDYFLMLRKLSFNRVSIGIQSFSDDLLKLMRRRHNADQGVRGVLDAQKAGFDNISIDLIYGVPGLTGELWEQTLEKTISLNVQHISAYHLTIERGTVFSAMNRKGQLKIVKESDSVSQFHELVEYCEKNGFIQYEISNFGKEGFFSIHNSNYWKQKKYLGVGPSAHSFDLESRQWNVSDNKIYIEKSLNGEIYHEKEILTEVDRINEYLMTSLRTMYGVEKDYVEKNFGKEYAEKIYYGVQKYIQGEYAEFKNGRLTLTKKGKFISDRIITELFVSND